MKVGTKLAIGAAVALIPMAVGLGLAVTQVDHLARQSASAAQQQHDAVQLALKILRALELRGEYRSKLEVTGDEGYRARLHEVEAQLAASLDALDRAELTSDERQAASALSRAVESRSDGSAASSQAARLAANELLDASRSALDEHAAWADARSRQTARVAIGGGLGAIAFSAIVAWLLVRAMNRPIRQLIRGTRAVATGDFDYRARPLASDELGEVTIAFNQMVDSLGQLERVKAELVSRVSHELRTPLVAMIETNQLLLDELPGALNEQQRRLLQLHDGAARRLSAMISDLLDLSALEATDSMVTRRIDVVSLTREVVEQLQPLARERAIALDVGFSAEELVIRGDARRYQQVVQNLLDNAFKHSPSGGLVHVGLTMAGADALPIPVGDQPEGSYAVLRVDDEGTGVAEADRERIFDKFVQAEGAGRGFGLGLAISRQIVVAHRGAVGVGGSALGGASFFAIFPIAQDAADREVSG